MQCAATGQCASQGLLVCFSNAPALVSVPASAFRNKTPVLTRPLRFNAPLSALAVLFAQCAATIQCPGQRPPVRLASAPELVSVPASAFKNKAPVLTRPLISSAPLSALAVVLMSAPELREAFPPAASCLVWSKPRRY